MKVNQEYYGNKSNWKSVPYEDSTGATYETNFKVPAWNNNSENWDYNNLYNGVESGAIDKTKNTIDNTICPWGINNNARFLKVLQPMPTRQAVFPSPEGETVDRVYSLNLKNVTVDPQYDKPMIVFSGGVFVNSDNPSLTNNKGLLTEGYISRLYESAYVATEFNYQDIVACCYLKVLKKQVNSLRPPISDVAVEDYFDEKNEVNYTQEDNIITGGYVKFFFRVKGNDINNQPVTDRVEDSLFSNCTPFSAYTYITPADNIFYENMFAPLADMRLFSYSTGVFGFNPSYAGNVIWESSSVIRATVEETFTRISETYDLSHVDNYCALGNEDDIANVIVDKNETDVEQDYINFYMNFNKLTKDEIYREFAYLGFWFTGSVESAKKSVTGIECTDDLMFLPVFDENVITTGTWKKGKETATLPNASWIDPRDSNNYDPNKKTSAGAGGIEPPVDKPSNADEDVSSQLHVMSIANAIPLYRLTYEQFRQLSNFINTTPYDGEKYYTEWYGLNPNDFLLFANAYAFEPELLESLSSNITLGKTLTGVSGYRISDNTILDFGKVSLNFGFADFRDFEPYSTYTLYVPYCGTYRIDPNVFLNHDLGVKVCVDFITNTAIVLIYRDNFIYDSFTSVMGYSVPITAREQGTYANSMVNAVAQKNMTAYQADTLGAYNVANGLVSSFSLKFDGYITNTLTQEMDENKIRYQQAVNQYNIDTMPQKPVTILGNGGASTKFVDEICRVVIMRHYLENVNEDVYSNTVGYACNITDILSNVHGYNVCSNIRMNNINGMTATEYNTLLSILTTGVILP